MRSVRRAAADLQPLQGRPLCTGACSQYSFLMCFATDEPPSCTQMYLLFCVGRMLTHAHSRIVVDRRSRLAARTQRGVGALAPTQRGVVVAPDAVRPRMGRRAPMRARARDSRIRETTSRR